MPYDRIGRLEVGTDSRLDNSKSVKTHLMQLFELHDNPGVEGVDVAGGAYSGTAALFNTVAWVEGVCWDQRLGLVVVPGRLVSQLSALPALSSHWPSPESIGRDSWQLFHCGVRYVTV